MTEALRKKRKRNFFALSIEGAVDYLTPADLERKTGKSARWCVKHLLRTGELPAFRLGASWRVRPVDYEAWAQSRIRSAYEPELVALPQAGPRKRKQGQGGK